MYYFLLKLHSGIRYIALMLLVASVVWAIYGLFTKKEYTESQRKTALFAMISAHTQLLVGLLLYFMSPMVNFSAIKVPEVRYWTMEHSTMMIFALVLITIGHVKAKKLKKDLDKHKKIVLFYGLALVVIVAALLQSGRGIF